MSNITAITVTLLDNLNELTTIKNKNHQQNFSISTSLLNEPVHTFAYTCMAFALVPQIIHLFSHGSRYIAGISYIWLIIRVLGLMSLIAGHAFKWLSILESIALISTVSIFIQIIFLHKNLHRLNKLILVIISSLVWIIGGGIFLFIKGQNRDDLLITIGYLLFAVDLLPQILLNSLLRTVKALSTFSIIFLSISYILLFYSLSTITHSNIYLIFTYYSLSFSLFICLQSILYQDAHIHLISRSAHTVLTPGVDVFTGLDANGTRSSGQEPQLFAIEDLEPMDEVDVIYQPVTTNKSSKPTIERTPMERFVWYASLALIVSIEILSTIMLVYYAWSSWIAFIPLSIPIILGIFFLLRTALSVFQEEYLRKVL